MFFIFFPNVVLRADSDFVHDSPSRGNFDFRFFRLKIRFFLLKYVFGAETVTQLGPFYWNKTAICWPGWPARFKIIIIHQNYVTNLKIEF